MTSTTRLILFTKAPIPGQVKTRLAKDIGPQDAAALHHAFLLDLGTTLQRLHSLDPSLAITLAISGPHDHDAFTTLSTLLPKHSRWTQGEGDLGARLQRAIQRSLIEEQDHACLIIGSDSPTLPLATLQDAIAALRATHQVTIGPACDGGYYLIGTNTYAPTLFDQIEWSSPRVFAQTLRQIRHAALSAHLLPFWYDVDTLQDVELLAAHLLDHLAHQHPDDYIETRRRLVELVQRGALSRSLLSSTR